MIAGHPGAHKEGHYRCSLPDLAEFMILCCTGPGYQTEIWNWTEKRQDLRHAYPTALFLKEILYPFQTVSSRKL